MINVGFLFSFGSCERFSFQFDLGFDRWIVHRARGIKPSSPPTLFDARGLYKLIMRRRKEEKLCLIDFFSVLVPYIVLLLVMVDVL